MVFIFKLNLEDVLVVWFDKGELWILFDELIFLGSDVGLVLDMYFLMVDDNQSGGGRDVKVFWYKEKWVICLFLKKIWYEVRKVNVECCFCMKGRFVKRILSNLQMLLCSFVYLLE